RPDLPIGLRSYRAIYFGFCRASILIERTLEAVVLTALSECVLTRHWLPRKDSNLDKEIQNLWCYRYTTRQAGCGAKPNPHFSLAQRNVRPKNSYFSGSSWARQVADERARRRRP